MVDRIGHALEQFDPSEEVHLVFSAHNVPAAKVEQGDPYPEQIAETVAAVLQRGAWGLPGGLPAHLCYQSKVGGARWLEPGLDSTIERLAAEGARNLLIVPIAFVSDHVETLSEIDIDARARALGLGIRRFAMMPGLNDSPLFIGALAGLVHQALAAAHPRALHAAAG